MEKDEADPEKEQKLQAAFRAWADIAFDSPLRPSLWARYVDIRDGNPVGTTFKGVSQGIVSWEDEHYGQSS